MLLDEIKRWGVKALMIKSEMPQLQTSDRV